MLSACSKALRFDSILKLIHPHSESGKQLMRKTLSDNHMDLATLQKEYERIRTLMKGIRSPELNNAIQDNLAHILCINTANLEPDRSFELHEIFELKQFIYYYQKLRELYTSSNLPTRDVLVDLYPLFEFLDPDGHRLPTFRLSPSYSPILSSAFEELSHLNLKLKTLQEQHLQEARKALDLPTLKAEFVISRMQKELSDQLATSKYFLLQSENTVNLSYKLCSTEQMNQIQIRIATLKDTIKTAEAEVLQRINLHLKSYRAEIILMINATASLDWDFSRAVFGNIYDCCIPNLDNESGIYLRGARNLPLIQHLKQDQREFQSIDIQMDTGVNVLTGPNMGGKTTALQTIGQMALLVRMGIPLPCLEARLPVYDFVWYNHDEQDQSEDLSSFGRETVSFVHALKHRGRGFILLDEFAKGTNPAEGEAIATATLRFLSKSKHTCLAATHYSAPAMMKDLAQFSIKGFDKETFDKLRSDSVTELKKRLILLGKAMDYSIIRLQDNQLPPMCAMEIAEILGLDPEIISAARALGHQSPD